MSKKQIQKSQFVPVTRGDIVEIKLTMLEPPRGNPFLATVIHVENRSGLTIDDTSELSPLLTIRREGSSRDEFFCNTYVTKIVSMVAR